MRTEARTLVQPIYGMSETIPQKPDGCTLIENFTVSKWNNGWDSRIGFESIKAMDGASSFTPFSGNVFSVFNWSTHNGAKTFLLYEDNLGSNVLSLRYYIGNGPSSVTLDNVRQTPAVNFLASTYEPFGKYLIIGNGSDEPIKFDGIKAIRLGFASVPSAPEPLPVSYDTEINDEDNPSTVIPVRKYPPASGDGDVASASQQHFRVDLTESWGLGSRTNGEDNTYRYKVTFVKADGSEGPISPKSTTVFWETGDTDKRQGIYLTDVPTGEDAEGIVARRIYRTGNMSNGAGGVSALYYFVGQISNNYETTFFDMVSDTRLGALAPSEDQSTIIPANPSIMATFKNCLFINSGGRLYYSLAGRPCQYQALDYFGAGATNSGDITALRTFFDNLIVFRQNGIDVISGNSIDGFHLTPFISGIGCVSKLAVCDVPMLGMMFMSMDGIYLLKGTVGSTGSNLNIQKMSGQIERTLERANKNMLSKCCAAYSQKWREAHFYFPFDGSTENELGLVFHLDRSSWSQRSSDFKVNCITTDNNEEFIYGTHDNTTTEKGLFYISRARETGVTYDAGSDEYSLDTTTLTSKFKSIEHDFGYGPVKKIIKYLYLYVLTQGDNTVTVTYFSNRNTSTSTSAAAVKLQRPEDADQAVYDAATSLWGTTEWQKSHLCLVRIPIANKKLSYFSFEFETDKDVQFLGYSLEYNVDAMKTRVGKR
jgi:hypothetical protein|tara:strand:+ start:6736 stop:8862 length:2127 start_codon:yes stop_codon:yes gene_type:complete